MRITYLGHASLLIEINGLRVITDPVFRRRIFHLVRTVPLPDREVYQDIDLVLISHLHYDHLDLKTIRTLGKHALVCVPKGAGRLLEKNRISNYRELIIGEGFSMKNLSIRTVYSWHVDRRHPLGLQARCMGYLIANEAVIYYPGDTRLFPEMASIADRIDVALMPVWGWGPHLGRMHMSPTQAGQALAFLKPRLAIPIHWGTYLPAGMGWLKPSFHSAPPLVFARAAARTMPEVEIRILNPGDTTEISL